MSKKKRKKKIKENPLKKALTLKQQRFCELYTSDIEFFGNGTQSYIEAYQPKQVGNWYKTVMSASSRLLRNVKVLAYLNSLLQEQGLNDQNVDKQLLFLLTQHADFKSKIGAIKEYNALKQRIQNTMEFGTETLEVLKKIQKTTVLLFESEKKKKE